ncbi:B3/B4 domain-containing protein [Desulfotomaculum defluvii]
MISISKELKDVCPNLTLGCIQATVKLKENDQALSAEIDKLCNQINQNTALEQVAQMPNIIDARETYKKLGKSPSRYRVSSEALMRRVLQGKGLYQINNIVDINNFVSLKSHYSVGTYDLDQVQSPIVFTIGKEGQTYKGIGKEFINIANLPIFADSKGPFGSPTSDSERAMITMDTAKILMNIISFSGTNKLPEYLALAKELLQTYADGTEIDIKIVQ